MPSARINGVVVAEAAADEVLSIEGNTYFPPSAVRAELLQRSPSPYTCPWKGSCQYFDVRDGDGWLHDRAWSYPQPKPTAIERVGADFSDYVAFWREVEVDD